MKRTLLTMCLLGTLAACGSPEFTPPRNLDDACALADERPQYFNAMERAERRWGVPVHVQMATIHQESRFDGDARTPYRFALGVIPMGRQSSAFGYSQALDATWEEYQVATRNRRADRTDIDDATDFIGWYFTLAQQELGLRLDDTREQYLAYHEGRAGYRRGSYNSKPWLLAVADRVEARAETYRLQLLSCR